MQCILDSYRHSLVFDGLHLGDDVPFTDGMTADAINVLWGGKSRVCCEITEFSSAMIGCT